MVTPQCRYGMCYAVGIALWNMSTVCLIPHACAVPHIFMMVFLYFSVFHFLAV